MIKSSSGYTFNRITKDSVALARIFSGIPAKRPLSNFKFRYYDTLLLRTLRDEPGKAMEIFKALFNNISYPTILRFLDEETSFLEDSLIFSGLPFIPLIRSVFKK
jgi:lycopene beta-cyclase